MSDNVKKLISRAMELSDEFGLLFGLMYRQENIRFEFSKDGKNVGCRFTLLEINHISHIDILYKIITDLIYEMLSDSSMKWTNELLGGKENG